MKLTAINVGYGDALLLQDEDKTLLIDGGSALEEEYSASPYRIRAADYLKNIGLEQIEILVISHIHEDHVCGLKSILQNWPVGEIWIPYDTGLFASPAAFRISGEAPESAKLFTQALADFIEILHQAKDKGISVRTMRAGTACVPWEGMRCSVLTPNEGSRIRFESLLAKAGEEARAGDATDTLVWLDRLSNEAGMALHFEAHGCSLLLAADCVSTNWEGDSHLFKNVNVLKLPHHGQIDSISKHYASILSPDYVITTASSDHRHASANKAVYELLQRETRKARAPTFLFTDEREYLPFFSNREGHCAVELLIESGCVYPEFIQKTN